MPVAGFELAAFLAAELVDGGGWSGGCGCLTWPNQPGASWGAGLCCQDSRGAQIGVKGDAYKGVKTDAEALAAGAGFVFEFGRESES